MPSRTLLWWHLKGSGVPDPVPVLEPFSAGLALMFPVEHSPAAQGVGDRDERCSCCICR